MCDQAFCFLPLIYIPDRYKTQEMCDRIISDDSFSLRYVPHQYKTQQMCDKALDHCLAALKFVPDWSVTSKMIKILFTFLYADENIFCFNEDSGNVVFIWNGIGIFNIDLNSNNLDDTNYEEDDPDIIIHVRLLVWHTKFEKRKALKKELNEELMLAGWHSKKMAEFSHVSRWEKRNRTNFYWVVFLMYTIWKY